MSEYLGSFRAVVLQKTGQKSKLVAYIKRIQSVNGHLVSVDFDKTARMPLM